MSNESTGFFHHFNSQLQCLSQLSFIGPLSAKKKFLCTKFSLCYYDVPRWCFLYIYLSLGLSKLFEFVNWCFVLHLRKLQPFCSHLFSYFFSVFNSKYIPWWCPKGHQDSVPCFLSVFLTSALQIECSLNLSSLSSSSLIMSSAVFKLC